MRICFIGGGNIATALIGALRESEPVIGVEVIDPSAAARTRLARDHAVPTHTEAVEPAATAAIRRADILVLAVKPQLLEAALAPVASVLEGHAKDDRLLVSVLAGTPLARLAELLPRVALVRAMPNTPALLGAGISGLCAGPGCRAHHREMAEKLLRGGGEVVWIEDEAQMHTVTAISGSGPAYFFLLIEALRDAGHALGLEPDIADRLAIATASGAGLMARRGDSPVDELRRQVTSPGGTTEAGVSALETGGLRELVEAAARAAAQRSRELAGESIQELNR